MTEHALSSCREVGAAEIEQHLKRLHAVGYSVIENALSPLMVADFLSKVRNLFDLHRNQMADVPDEWDAMWVLNLQNKDKAFIDLLGLPVLDALLKPMLNDPYFRGVPSGESNYILGQFVARSSVKALQLHIDAGMPQPGPNTTMVQCGLVLEDTDERNGCTVFVPGSHLLGEYSDRDLHHVYPVPAKAGDLVIWDARVWHGSGPNTSDGTRWCIIATFQRWWVKQSFDMPRALPQAIYERLADRQKALIGFSTIPPLDETKRRTRAIPYAAFAPTVDAFYER